MLINIGFEVRDVYPAAEDFLYHFIGSKAHITLEELTEVFGNGNIPADQREKLLDLLLWYGFFGIVREDGEIAYIYSVKYDMKRLKALVRKQQENIVLYYINPAFWSGLEIKHGD